jgi:hypothetical protein
MTAKAEFELTANDQSAKAAWDRQQNAINAVIARIGKMEEAQAKAAKTQDGFFTKGVAGLATMAAGALTFQGALGGVIDANRQMIDQASAAALKYDDLFRKLRVQAALGELQSVDAQTSVLGVAKKYGFTAEETAAAATQLVSSGFSAKDASGEALDVFIKGAAASNLQGKDTTALAQSVSQLLNSQGQKLNAENLKVVMQGTQRLFESNNIQLSDLSQLAGKGLSFKGRASVPELLGLMTVGKDVLGADNAATGIKIVGDRLMGAKGDSQREGVLKSMGLKPEDVDLIGENIGQVLDSLATGLERLKPEQRAGQLQKLFGTEAAGAASLFIDNRAKLDALVKQQADEKGFNEAANRATGGKGAAVRRQQVIDEEEAAARDTGFDEKLKAVRRRDRNAGQSAVSTDFGTLAARTLKYMGASDEAALALSFGGDATNPTRPVGATAAGLSDAAALLKSAEEQKQLLRELVKNTAKPPVVIEKPAVAKKPASAAAGTGGR